MSYEIEYEFRESDAGAEFVPCGKVVETIRGYLAAERIDLAVALLVQAAPDVGDQLMAEFQTASRALRGRLADAFFNARDFERAARCADALGDLARAASYYEANYELGKAAALWAQAQEPARAAQLYERNLDFLQAAELYTQTKDFLRAAECYERANSFYEAGLLYLKCGRHDRAVELLQRVDRMHRTFVEANRLLGSYFERTGNAELAMQRYVDVVRTRSAEPAALDAHVRLAQLYATRGHPQHAEALLRGVLEVDPGNAAAARAIALVPGRQQVPPAQTIPIEEAEASSTAQTGRVMRMESELAAIWSLPIFSELSTEDLRALAALADRIRVPAGAVLIEQGRPGSALFVILDGQLRVLGTARPGGTPSELGMLGPGASIGEMALCDDGPTSATVTAATDAVLLRFPMERLRHRLAASERTELGVLRVLARSLSERLRATNERLSRCGG